MPEDPLKLFGQNVRRLRAERGFSQESFADHVGLHRTYVGDIERGLRNVALRNIVKIANALDASPSELFAGIFASD